MFKPEAVGRITTSDMRDSKYFYFIQTAEADPPPAYLRNSQPIIGIGFLRWTMMIDPLDFNLQLSLVLEPTRSRDAPLSLACRPMTLFHVSYRGQ